MVLNVVIDEYLNLKTKPAFVSSLQIISVSKSD